MERLISGSEKEEGDNHADRYGGLREKDDKTAGGDVIHCKSLHGGYKKRKKIRKREKLCRAMSLSRYLRLHREFPSQSTCA